ncbi:MAG: AMP-binding protein [Gammaproteobacteria bacterium]|nr:AMP-binding protein [Gammaproteobacteria bacterium]
MAHFTARVAANRGGAIALIDDRRTLSWAELDARTNQLVHALRAAGLQVQDTIAVFAGNCVEYFEIMLACTHSGIVFVPVNWHFSAEELAYVINDSGAKLLLVEDAYLATAETAIARGETPTLTKCISIRGQADGFEAFEDFVADQPTTDPKAQCLGGPMFYTSGTTGRPKGVKSSTFAAGADLATMELIGGGLAQMLSIPNDGTTYICGPVYHSAQWAFSFLPFINGSQVVMRHRFDGEQALMDIDTHNVTNVHLVPTQFHRLLRVEETARNGFDGKSLQVVWHGAAPCPPTVKQAMIDWWGHVIFEYYGSTEGSIVTTATSEDWLAKPGTVGKPTPIVEITIRDDDGNVVDTGESGEIFVKNLMGSDFEYHNEPEKTASVHLEPGTYTFGDIGYLDDDGYLFLSDRKIDMIISGGVNIYPAEIEAVLVTHPRIEDAAVFGIPNEEFGEEVKAAVKLCPGVDANDALAEDLIQHCRDHLAGYKAPRSIDFVDEFPRHETGKLYKRLLRDRYWQDRTSNI